MRAMISDALKSAIQRWEADTESSRIEMSRLPKNTLVYNALAVRIGWNNVVVVLMEDILKVAKWNETIKLIKEKDNE